MHVEQFDPHDARTRAIAIELVLERGHYAAFELLAASGQHVVQRRRRHRRL